MFNIRWRADFRLHETAYECVPPVGFSRPITYRTENERKISCRTAGLEFGRVSLPDLIWAFNNKQPLLVNPPRISLRDSGLNLKNQRFDSLLIHPVHVHLRELQGAVEEGLEACSSNFDVRLCEKEPKRVRCRSGSILNSENHMQYPAQARN